MSERRARPAIGELAPAIEARRADGGRWSLAAMQGRPVVVVFHRHIH